MNPITNIVFFLTWDFHFIWAIKTMLRGWDVMSKSSPPPTGIWTTQVKKPVHPEMIDVEPGTELMGVNFDDKKDDPLLQSLQDRIEELDNKEEEDVAFIGVIIEHFDDLMIDETMNKDDRAVLNIINEILKNYHKLNIYNKKQLYMYVREATDLPSRKITKSIKKIKTSYVVLKDDFIN